jgi:hypothetical protein
MTAGFRILDNVCNLNSFREADEITLRRGEATEICFMLKSVDNSCEEAKEIRYIPPTGSTVTVTFNHIDSNKVITRTATQKYSDDKSIYSVPILATDRLSFNSMSVKVTNTSPVLDKGFKALTDIKVEETDSNRYFC